VSLLTSDDVQAVLLSLGVSTAATLCGVPVAFMAALALARGRFIGRSILDALVHLPLVVPPVATGFALLVLLGRKGLVGIALARMGIVFAFDWKGAALAAAVMAFPLMVRPMRLAIDAIDREVDEAALTLGAGRLARLWRVTLPLALPGVLAGAVLGWARALGEFGATITFVAAIPGETLTLPTAIYQATQDPGQESHALLLCALAATIAVAAVLASDAMGRRTAVSRPDRSGL